MSMDKMTVPTKIKVGFNKRPDCYTGMLGYVIYQDAKGIWRKEPSWEGWRDKKIAAQFFDNVPTDGFVLNRKTGGVKESWGWNTRLERVRVYDPRGFEFEITIPNLLFILRETDCSRGKGLEGQFVYAWAGKELVLCPTNAQEYKDSISFTALQTKNIKAKELVPGVTYLTKKQEKLIYLGRFDVYVHGYERYSYRSKSKPVPNREYVFLNPDHDAKKFVKSAANFVFMESPKNLAAVVTDVVDSNLAEYLEAFGKSNYGSPIKELFLQEAGRLASVHDNDWQDLFAVEDPKEQGAYFLISGGGQNSPGYPPHEVYQCRVTLKNGQIIWQHMGDYVYKHGNYAYSHYRSQSVYPFVEPSKIRLFAKMESGSVFRVGDGNLIKHKKEVVNA